MLYFCVICGVLISRTSIAPGTVPTEDLEWYQQLRVDNANISGVGFFNSLDRILAPLDYQNSFTDANANLVSYTPFRDPELGTWCFSFHVLCWEIQLQRVPEGRSNITKFSTIFFQTFMRPGHEYGGAAQFQKPVGNPIRSIIDQRFAHLLGHPLQFLDVPELLSSLTQSTRSYPQRPTIITAWNSSLRYDAFSSFSPEIFYMIISLLSSADLQQLRLASRCAEHMIDPTSLPQSFWRSIFCTDFEMGFASPIDTSGHLNWRDAYFMLKHALRDSSSSARLKNRHRIWRLAAETLPRVSSPGAMIRTQFSADVHKLLLSGSRRLEDRHIVLPLDELVITSIQISTVRFNLQEFISGLKFQLVNTSTRTFTGLQLGYMSPGTNRSIIIAPSVHVMGFEVASCVRGVTGIRVVVDGGAQPQWVGNEGNGEAYIAIGQLTLTRKTRLIASFDIYDPRFRSFNPILIMDFGGPNGRRLPQLTKIVAHMLKKSAPFDGLAFYFKDQSCINFGGQGPMEVSSLIDGPVKSAKNDQVLSHRLRTNFGNVFIFSRDELGYSQATKSENPFIQTEKKTVETLEAPTGQQITGLTAVLEACNVREAQRPSGLPTGIGVLTDSLSESARSASSLGSYLIGEVSNHCRAYTSAPLQSVKRIRFSSGKTGRPRCYSEVSGLWFDYHRSRSSIVGQWFSESASMSLDEGEIITGVTIWLSNGRESFSQKYYTGLVVWVSISTSLRTVSYPDEVSFPTDKHTVVRFQENRQENRLKDLSYLAWVFNDAWDFPRVISRLKMPDTKLILWDTNNFLSRRYYGRDDQYLITGLRFTYRSGASGVIGDVSGRQIHEPSTFEPDEEVRKVELFMDWIGLFQIIVSRTSPDTYVITRKCLVSLQKRHRGDRPSMAGQFNRHEVDFSRRKFSKHYFGADYTAQDERECLPKGDVVGIWGFEMPEEKFHIGFVFLEES
ncbi:hypothetical protein BJX99DRAFT_271716 [Aspergillus californicus]